MFFKKKINHFYGLDLFRGISGYGVAIAHFFAFTFDSTFCEYLSFLFVEFFFVLSGFVLFPQLLQIYKNKNNLLLFYKRRWMRTLPVYFFSLITVSLIVNNLFSFDFLKYFLLIQDFYPNFLDKNYFPIVWSLSIEEFFYLVFPLLILTFKKENLINGLLILIFFIILIKLFLVNYFDSDFLRIGTLFRFDAILLGFLARFFYKKFNFLTTLISSLILFFLYVGLQDFVTENNDTFLLKFFFVYFMQFLSLSMLLLFLNIEKIMQNKYLKIFSSFISKQTYSVYLFHMIYIYILYDVKMSASFKFLFYMSLLVISSTISYYFLEKPILEKRKKLI